MGKVSIDESQKISKLVAILSSFKLKRVTGTEQHYKRTNKLQNRHFRIIKFCKLPWHRLWGTSSWVHYETPVIGVHYGTSEVITFFGFQHNFQVPEWFPIKQVPKTLMGSVRNYATVIQIYKSFWSYLVNSIQSCIFYIMIQTSSLSTHSLVTFIPLNKYTGIATITFPQYKSLKQGNCNQNLLLRPHLLSCLQHMFLKRCTGISICSKCPRIKQNNVHVSKHQIFWNRNKKLTLLKFGHDTPIKF